jgi:hypothetical protein
MIGNVNYGKKKPSKKPPLAPKPPVADPEEVKADA